MSYENKGLKVGLRDIDEIIKLVDRLSGRLNAFNVIGKEVIVNVSQGNYEIELAVEVRPNRPFNRVVKLPIFDAQTIRLTGVPSLKPIDDSIIRDETDGLILSLDYIPPNVDTILLNIKCPLSHRRFLERIVNKNVQMEPRKDVTSYWMSAQFKHLESLRKKMDSIRIEDLDFFVGVHIEQNIKEIIPHMFIRQLEVGKELLQTKDREMKQRLAKEHLRLSQSNKLVGKEEIVIEKIEEILKPTNFEKYLNFLGQFYYYDCHQAGSYLRVPNFVLPSMMRVVTKTTLTLEEPAKKGELQFLRKNFDEEFEEIFPKGLRRKKKK